MCYFRVFDALLSKKSELLASHRRGLQLNRSVKEAYSPVKLLAKHFEFTAGPTGHDYFFFNRFF